MDMQFHCLIEKASVEEEKMSFSHTASYDAVRVEYRKGTECVEHLSAQYLGIQKTNTDQMTLFLH